VKVLHIIPSLKAGGAEKLLSDLLVSLKISGLDVELMLLDGVDARFLGQVTESGIPVEISKIKDCYSARQIREIRKVVRDSHPDIVHTHLFPAQLWSALSLRSFGVRLITTEHSTFNRRRKHRVFKLLDRAVYHPYERIICNSRATKEALDDWLPGVKTKSVVIPNGIVKEVYANAEPYLKRDFLGGILDNVRIIAVVSRFSQAKDHATVIRALALLPDAYHLLLVGEGPTASEAKELAYALGVMGRAHFIGVRQDVARILKSADLLVQSSHWEGFGLSAVEGMAAGLPVIVSDTPGLAETFEDFALTFHRGDALALSERIRSLEAPSFYEERRERSLAGAQRFDISRMRIRYREVYDQVMGEN